MNSKFLLAVLAATIVGFFGGWLIWGILLENYYAANSTDAAKAMARADEDMVMWAMVVAQLVWGIFLTWLLDKMGDRSFASGAMSGAIIGGLYSLSLNLFFYAMMDMHTGLGVVFVDVLVNIVFTAVLGGVVGWILGSGNTAEGAMN